MITYDDLQKANKTIKTTDIKGKKYAEVNQRIKAFRMVYPEGTIETALLKCEDGVCVMRAEVMIKEDNGMRVLGTGTAYEKEDSSFINKTSYIENCETSAVGRALGMAGFGIDTSVASFEEVANAIEQQNNDITINKNMETTIRNKIKELDLDNDKVLALLKMYGHEKLSEIKVVEYKEFFDKLTKEE